MELKETELGKGLWVKLSVDYQLDPRIMDVGAEAELLFVRSLAWGKRKGDGTIARSALTMLGLGLENPVASAEALVQSGLWTDMGSVFQITSWANWQTDPEMVAKRSEAGLLGMHKRWHKMKPHPDCPHCHNTPVTPVIEELMPEVELELEKETYSPNPDAERLCDALAEMMHRNGAKKPKITTQWLIAMDRLLRLDGRPFEEAMGVLRWSQDDSFWKANIHSPIKFRQKYDQLKMRSGIGVPGDDSLSAWAEVMEGVRRFGSYNDPVWSNKKLYEVVRGIGWNKICLSDRPEQMRARFIELWKQSS